MLKTVAQTLSAKVRERDLAARLAGDEFIVLFSDTDETVAREILTRIQDAIGSFNWDAIGPGLNVSLSIGLSQAVVGDKVESIVHRSDKSMYSEKARPTLGAHAPLRRSCRALWRYQIQALS